MPAVGPKISIAVEPPKAFIRIVGRAAVESSRDFKELVLRLTGNGVDHFVLDLRACLLMDSTFSGVLAGLILPPATARSSTAPPSVTPRFTLVQPNERVADLMDNLGVLSLVQRVEFSEVSPPGARVEELPVGQHSKEDVADCCLEAHQILMSLKPENVAKFRALEQVLIAQLGENRPAHRNPSGS